MAVNKICLFFPLPPLREDSSSLDDDDDDDEEEPSMSDLEFELEFILFDSLEYQSSEVKRIHNMSS